MIKRPTLNGRKRISELAQSPEICLAKKEQLVQLQAEVEDTQVERSHRIKDLDFSPAAEASPAAPAVAAVSIPKMKYSKACPTKPEDMLAYLEAYAKQLEKTFSTMSTQESSKEQKEMLRQQIGALVNARAQQLERKGVTGKAKRMQCEALLYTLTEGLKKQKNIDLRSMRLIEKCQRD